MTKMGELDEFFGRYLGQVDCKNYGTKPGNWGIM